ncbi:MAG: FeoC-like transcriptional regulator [Candidatus Cloacimonadota bacterium]|nr:FeoC-like transcriptional regulator [Candidatus Cloacimonadota bacterium]
MLRKIKNLFRERKTLDIGELSIYFKISESAIEGMLKLLMQKKFIQKLEFDCGTCSSSCSGCPFSNHKDVYELTKQKSM